jgi:hypothetical protein
MADGRDGRDGADGPSQSYLGLGSSQWSQAGPPGPAWVGDLHCDKREIDRLSIPPVLRQAVDSTEQIECRQTVLFIMKGRIFLAHNVISIHLHLSGVTSSLISLLSTCGPQKEYRAIPWPECIHQSQPLSPI